MNRLRRIAEELGTIIRDDNSCGSIDYVLMDADYAPNDFDTYGDYIVMMWYKNRGRTSNAVFMTNKEIVPLTIKHAELAIKTFKEDRLKWLQARNDRT